jgi:hypothetical protein
MGDWGIIMNWNIVSLLLKEYVDSVLRASLYFVQLILFQYGLRHKFLQNYYLW